MTLLQNLSLLEDAYPRGVRTGQRIELLSVIS